MINNLIIDAARDKIFLTFIVDKNIYTCTHENSKINFEKLMTIINEFLRINKFSLDDVGIIYVNRGPGSFAGIRNSLSTTKALFLTKKIDYYCFSFEDFNEPKTIKYEDVPLLCKEYKIKSVTLNKPSRETIESIKVDKYKEYLLQRYVKVVQEPNTNEFIVIIIPSKD